jgi:hypothetical protein
LAVYKDTEVREGMTLQLRMDAQNAFNHAQFSNPITTLGPAGDIGEFGLGDVTSDAGPRIVQLGVRFIF